MSIKSMRSCSGSCHFHQTPRYNCIAAQVIFVDPAANKGALNFFGVSEDKLPAVLIHDGANDAKYNSGVIEVSGMKKFVDDFSAGKLEKTVKSEDPPADNSGPVTIATANTLKDIVDGGKNVLIEFYAPCAPRWLGTHVPRDSIACYLCTPCVRCISVHPRCAAPGQCAWHERAHTVARFVVRCSLHTACKHAGGTSMLPPQGAIC